MSRASAIASANEAFSEGAGRLSGAWRLPHKSSIDEIEHHRLRERRSAWSPLRLTLGDVVEKKSYEIALCLMICANTALIIHETNSRAARQQLSLVLTIIDALFFISYVVDLMVRLFVYRSHFFRSNWNLMDLFVVVSDVASTLLTLVYADLPSIAVVRICRIFRLMRFVHLLVLFRELHIMLTGFISAMKAMFWASLILFMMLTFWSILAVEVLHPINLKIAERGEYKECDRCPRAFSSVLDSNLTFMQQILAGDSWGEVSIPIIEEQPWTWTIFFAVMITINLGLLNLVLTVIVDVATLARDADEQRRLAEKTADFENARESLLQICSDLDLDENGSLTFDEIQQGMNDHPAFAATMALLDVTKDDTELVFRMLDEDGSGNVSYREFVEQLHKMKSQDTHTMLVFVKGYLNEIRFRVKETMGFLKHGVAEDLKDLRCCWQDDVCARWDRLNQTMSALVFGGEVAAAPRAEDRKEPPRCPVCPCPRKHPLREMHVYQKSIDCHQCEWSVPRGQKVWSCSQCNYCRCTECEAAAVRAAGALHAAAVAVERAAAKDSFAVGGSPEDGCKVGEEALAPGLPLREEAAALARRGGGGGGDQDGDAKAANEGWQEEHAADAPPKSLPLGTGEGLCGGGGGGGVAGSKSAQGQVEAKGREGGSGQNGRLLGLCRLEDDIQRLLRRIEGELAQLLRDTARKVDVQTSLLQDRPPASWPPDSAWPPDCGDLFRPSAPGTAGVVYPAATGTLARGGSGQHPPLRPTSRV